MCKLHYYKTLLSVQAVMILCTRVTLPGENYRISFPEKTHALKEDVNVT